MTYYINKKTFIHGPIILCESSDTFISILVFRKGFKTYLNQANWKKIDYQH